MSFLRPKDIELFYGKEEPKLFELATATISIPYKQWLKHLDHAIQTAPPYTTLKVPTSRIQQVATHLIKRNHSTLRVVLEGSPDLSLDATTRTIFIPLHNWAAHASYALTKAPPGTTLIAPDSDIRDALIFIIKEIGKDLFVTCGNNTATQSTHSL